MFWTLFLIVAALISIAVLNPVPVVAALILMAIGKTAEAPHVAIVEAAGGNPDLPKPTSGTGCLAFLIAIVLFSLLGLIALAAIVGILEGAI